MLSLIAMKVRTEEVMKTEKVKLFRRPILELQKQQTIRPVRRDSAERIRSQVNPHRRDQLGHILIQKCELSERISRRRIKRISKTDPRNHSGIIPLALKLVRINLRSLQRLTVSGPYHHRQLRG